MEHVLLEKKDGIAIITVNRPKQLNALNTAVINDLAEAVSLVENDDEVRVVIVTGAGEKSFVAGADIAEMSTLTPEEARAFSTNGSVAFRRLEKMPKPVIGAINGYALGGGCELAMACDMRVASENAVFAQPETGLGIIPGFGGTQRLARLVGSGRAKEMIFSCNRIDAQEAWRIGLVNRVVPSAELMDTCFAIAGKMMRSSSEALRTSKEAIDTGLSGSLDDGLAFESDIFGVCFATQEQKDAMQAFLNRSKK
jgi:enoyl-CoA hydratase